GQLLKLRRSRGNSLASWVGSEVELLFRRIDRKAEPVQAIAKAQKRGSIVPDCLMEIRNDGSGLYFNADALGSDEPNWQTVKIAADRANMRSELRGSELARPREMYLSGRFEAAYQIRRAGIDDRPHFDSVNLHP